MGGDGGGGGGWGRGFEGSDLQRFRGLHNGPGPQKQTNKQMLLLLCSHFLL